MVERKFSSKGIPPNKIHGNDYVWDNDRGTRHP